MAEETNKSTPEAPCAAEGVVVSDVQPATSVIEKEVPTPEKVEEPAAEGDQKDTDKEENKISESGSFKEESNKVDDLIDPEKKALDEFKQLIQAALNKHEFTAPPPPEKKEEEEPKKEDEEEAKPEEKKKEAEEEAETKEKTTETTCEAEPVAMAVEEEEATPAPAVAETKVEEKVEEEEEIKETIVIAPACEEEKEEEEEEKEAEEVSIWGVPLLADERSDVILLKFLRARDFKVKEALSMLKSVVAWRKKFKIEEFFLEQEEDELIVLRKVVYIHGVDREGHPICYNAFGEFQEDKDLYSNTFSDAEKRSKFLRWYIQFLEKNIRKLDFHATSCSTIVQVIDLKNSPQLILSKKDLRQATNQALQLLQDNYPEFVAKQVFKNINLLYLSSSL